MRQEKHRIQDLDAGVRVDIDALVFRPSVIGKMLADASILYELDLHISQCSVHCGRADLDGDNRVECCYGLLKRLELDELVWENTELPWKRESIH